MKDNIINYKTNIDTPKLWILYRWTTTIQLFTKTKINQTKSANKLIKKFPFVNNIIDFYLF